MLDSLPMFRAHERRHKFGLNIVIIACALMAASVAIAADYSVQIGAFSKINETFAGSASELGDVYSTRNADGVTALSIGRFASREAATDDLFRLQQAYPDAFVRELTPESQPYADQRVFGSEVIDREQDLVAETTLPVERSTVQNQVARQTVLTGAGNSLNSLSPDQRRNVVLLDGVLHLKQGDQFTRLEN